MFKPKNIAMQRTLTKYLILALGIFTADVVKEFVLHYSHDYIYQKSPFMATFLRMAVSVVVFYPIFLILDEYTKAFSKTYVSKTKEVFGSGMKALLVGGGIALLALYFTFLWLWYKVDVLHVFR